MEKKTSADVTPCFGFFWKLSDLGIGHQGQGHSPVQITNALTTVCKYKLNSSLDRKEIRPMSKCLHADFSNTNGISTSLLLFALKEWKS